MRVTLPFDFQQHFINLPKNSLGIIRQLWVRDFSLDLINKRFSLRVIIKHYHALKEVIPAVHEEEELVTEEEIIIHPDTPGDYINELQSVIDLHDEFVGDEQIMVYYDPINPTHERTGEVLNPDRNAVTEAVPYISQYEFIYMAFLNPVAVWTMIKTLLENYNNYPE